MLRAFQLNAHQLSQAVIANGHSIDNMWELRHALKLHSDWLRTSELDQNAKNVEIMADKVAKQYILALEKMSSHMTASLSRYDLHAMVYGIAILVQSFCWVAFGLCALSSQEKTKGDIGTSVTSVFLLSGVVLLIAVLHLSTCSSIWIGKEVKVRFSSFNSIVVFGHLGSFCLVRMTWSTDSCHMEKIRDHVKGNIFQASQLSIFPIMGGQVWDLSIVTDRM